MNGEMFQICSIVAAGKMALKDKKPIDFSLGKYESSATFVFLPQKNLFHTEKYTAPDVASWFMKLLKKSLDDIKILCPYSVKDRNILGFANTSQTCILCFFKNGKVTYFTPNWHFDQTKRCWNIVYTEAACENPPQGKPKFQNNIEDFRKVLSDIEKLANDIDCTSFAEIFKNARAILDGNEVKDFKLKLAQLPELNQKLFNAAYLSDVFGAMGSWNDSPPYMADEKGLSKEYETLSSELLKNIRLSILYSINEW